LGYSLGDWLRDGLSIGVTFAWLSHITASWFCESIGDGLSCAGELSAWLSKVAASCLSFRVTFTGLSEISASWLGFTLAWLVISGTKSDRFTFDEFRLY
jgi:hypothetical protein